MADPSTLLAFGDSVKFLNDEKTRIGGYAVRYTGPSDPDLYGDFFTSSTDFGHDDLDGLKMRLYYEHGMNALKSAAIGRGTFKSDDKGLWYEAELEESNEYIEYIRELIEQGRIGYSSGAVGHLVEREPAGGKAYWIKTWPLGEISITKKPAEPRNLVSLKSLYELAAEASKQGDATRSPEDEAEAPPVKGAPTSAAGAEPAELPPTPADTEPTVENETKSAETKEAPQEQPKAAAAEDAIKRLEARIEAMQKSFEESKTSTVTKNTVVETPNVPTIRTGGIKSDTERNAFERWVRTGDTGGVKHLITGDQGGNPIVEIKASNAVDMQVGTAAEGGNVVTDDMYPAILARRDEMLLADKIGVRRFTGTGTTIDVPLDAEADGEFVVKAEEGTFDKDSPALGQTSLTLAKYTKYFDITYELLQDQSANVVDFVQEWVARGVAKTHNNLLVTEAVANGSELATTAATTAAVLGELEDVVYDDDLAFYLDNPSDGAWVMKPSTYGNLISITQSTYRAYAELAQGARGNQSILGYPVHFSNKVDAYGTANNRFAHFANWFYYMGLYEDPRLQFLRDPYTVAVSGQVRLLWYFRCDYGVLQSEAGGFIRHITT